MNKHVPVFLSLFLCSLGGFAQLTFQNVYGGSSTDAANAVRQTFDGGYILAGTTTSFNTDSDANIYLIKTDANGDTLWTKTYGGSGYDGGSDVQQTTDSGFIIVGSTASFGAGLDDIYLVKTDASGDTLWTKAYGGSDEDEGYSVQQTADGGYIIAGSTMSFGAGDEDVYLVKTDGSGNQQWSKTYGGTGIDVGNCVRQTKDGGYIVAGETFSFGAGGLDVYLIKTDDNGGITWSTTYGGNADDDGIAVEQTADEGYIVTGFTASFGAGNYDLYLLKTNSAGGVAWSKAYGGVSDDEGYAVQQTNDGGYIVCGYTSNFGFGNANVYLIKTAANGDTLWTKVYGGTDYDAGNSILQTPDGGYIVAGYSNIINPGGDENVYLFKTDSAGNTACNEDTTATIVTSSLTLAGSAATVVSSESLTNSTATITGSGGNVITLCASAGISEVIKNDSYIIYPDPFTTSATIILNTLPVFPLQIAIYDVTGRMVQNSLMKSKATVINRNGLPAGMYFCRITDHAGVAVTSKLIIQ